MKVLQFSKFYPPVHGELSRLHLILAKELQKVMVSLLTFSVLILLGKEKTTESFVIRFTARNCLHSFSRHRYLSP